MASQARCFASDHVAKSDGRCSTDASVCCDDCLSTRGRFGASVTAVGARTGEGVVGAALGIGAAGAALGISSNSSRATGDSFWRSRRAICCRSVRRPRLPFHDPLVSRPRRILGCGHAYRGWGQRASRPRCPGRWALRWATHAQYAPSTPQRASRALQWATKAQAKRRACAPATTASWLHQRMRASSVAAYRR